MKAFNSLTFPVYLLFYIHGPYVCTWYLCTWHMHIFKLTLFNFAFLLQLVYTIIKEVDDVLLMSVHTPPQRQPHNINFFLI